MTWRAVVLVLVLTGALPRPAVAAYPLVIRTYNNNVTSDADLRAARAHAENIFTAAGIEVVWRNCWSEDQPSGHLPAECGQQPRANDVLVRLVCSNQSSKKRYISMGHALINIPHRRPFLATVFADLVALVARNAQADFGQLLGRAIAHEIGHLLLNENRHAATGLMRADWSQRDLRDDRPRDWKFRDDEVAIIRSAVRERHGLVGD